jgi:hypothetical protein
MIKRGIYEFRRLAMAERSTSFGSAGILGLAPASEGSYAHGLEENGEKGGQSQGRDKSGA